MFKIHTLQAAFGDSLILEFGTRHAEALGAD